MNKAFTANINDQVTARGYLDENNQLIMLEPEGSGGGGGGELKTANVSIYNNSNNEILLPVFYEDGYIGATTIVDDDGDFTIPMAAAGATLMIIQPASVNITLTGDIVNGKFQGDLLVTGDGTITIESK